jgi:hypothetical protein
VLGDISDAFEVENFEERRLSELYRGNKVLR